MGHLELCSIDMNPNYSSSTFFWSFWTSSLSDSSAVLQGEGEWDPKKEESDENNQKVCHKCDQNVCLRSPAPSGRHIGWKTVSSAYRQIIRIRVNVNTLMITFEKNLYGKCFPRLHGNPVQFGFYLNSGVQTTWHTFLPSSAMVMQVPQIHRWAAFMALWKGAKHSCRLLMEQQLMEKYILVEIR